MAVLSRQKLRIVQVLPELNAGGVERGTVEFARELVKAGHESIVISSGGRQVPKLESEGSRHITALVHKKSLASFFQIRPMRRLLADLKPDIVHVRSRMPAWIVWLAWRKMNPEIRPKLISTFHGMYSVNAYSAIMAKSEHIISISDCVSDYIFRNYAVSPDKLTRIYRGLDRNSFSEGSNIDKWKDELFLKYPQFKSKKLILMPGRLTRWKGQEAFLSMMNVLVGIDPRCHGIIVGEAESNKEHYLQELTVQCSRLGLDDKVTFVGHRSDINNFYSLSAVACHMSNKAEPFGRTVTEALASGVPVVAYDRGGASESLRAGFPEGLVAADDIAAFAHKVSALLDSEANIQLPDEFYLDSQARETLNVYYRALES
ncbi:glycosyltransferase family 4 protein [Alkalimarinus alittae]|uniref:Glycosyltransferase family 4 protein n=1 Tax=Alkalimarinus alittae TaxID=2961619 RepID=A0ABY6N174_9ALTE|nr:glycosyltransferase family 4 protein [Alkalimarinus alittae]UZE95762.1 glycosyltransferase family 4 protein [Alkalimarinus alittae]